MSTWTGDVTHTKTWISVEVEADSEDEAEIALDKMKEEELTRKAGEPDVEVEVSAVECSEEEEG